MTWLFSKALMQDYENSRCSQGLVAESSEVTCSDGEPYAQLNVMPTPHKFWRNDKTMEPCDLSRFGLTLRLLTDDHGAALLTWYLEDFLARTLAQQEKGQDLQESAPHSGEKWRALLAKYDRDTHSLKTAQCSLIEGLSESSVILPKWGSMRNGELSEQMPLAHYIGESESGSLLPTPSGCRSGKNHVSGRLDEWGGSSNPWRRTEIGKTKSPCFEEWMMGWPITWTRLIAYETDKFQQWQQQHGGF